MLDAGRIYIPRPDLLYHRLRFRQRTSNAKLPALEEILAFYDLKLLERPQAPPGEGRSHSLVLSTSQGKKLLKRYKPTVKEPAIIHEHSILSFLEQEGFPSPRLVTSPSRETLTSHNGYHFALFDFVEGGYQYHNYLLLPGQLQRFIAAAGKIMAILHETLKDFVPKGYNLNGFRSRNDRRWRDRDWYADKLTYCISMTQDMIRSSDRTEAAWLLHYADFFEESLNRLDDSLKQAVLPRVIIHGDYGSYNLLFRRDGSYMVLDFEIARLDWRATDLVDALWRFSHNRFGFNLAKMDCLLSAYRSRAAVTSEEIQSLPDVWIFLNVRRCIMYWHQYCESLDSQRLSRAQWYMNLISWMRENRDTFLTRLMKAGV